MTASPVPPSDNWKRTARHDSKMATGASREPRARSESFVSPSPFCLALSLSIIISTEMLLSVPVCPPFSLYYASIMPLC